MPYSERTLNSLVQRFTNTSTLSRVIAGEAFDFQGTTYAVAHFGNKPAHVFAIDAKGGVKPATLDLATLVGNLNGVLFKNTAASPTSNGTTAALSRVISGDDFTFRGKTLAITHYAYIPAQLHEVSPDGKISPANLNLADLVGNVGEIGYPEPTPRAIDAAMFAAPATPLLASSRP